MVNRFKKLFSKNSKWLEKKQTSLLSAAFIIIIANIGSSLFGLLRYRYQISTFFGDKMSELGLVSLEVAFQIPDTLYLFPALLSISALGNENFKRRMKSYLVAFLACNPK